MRARDLAERRQAGTAPMLRNAIAVLFAAALSIAAPASSAENRIPFDVAKLFFQLNDTDQDLGIHAIIDGEAWKRLEIEDPNERVILTIWATGQLRAQGLTELRFESAEPSFEELPAEEFFKRFPPGRYEIGGVTLDGLELESTVKITHVMPAPPQLRVAGTSASPGCESPLSVNEPVTISWDAVTKSHPTVGKPGPIQIVRYELAVEREEPTTLILTADLPPSVTAFTVPSGLLSSGDEIKFQVLATDAGGNETSSESCFVVQ